MAVRLLRRCVAWGVALACALAWPGLASGEGPRVVSSARYGVSVEAPGSWRLLEAPPGVVSVFAEAEPSRTRLELRASPQIPAGQRGAYVEALRHAIKEGGWSEEEAPRSIRYGALDGQELRFRGEGGLVLVVFAFYQEEMAYLLLGYLEPARLESLYERFQGVARTIALKGGQEP